MAISFCPDCDGQISLSQARLGQKLICPYCETQLEVISVEPLELDWAIDWPDEDEWAEEREEEERG
jgi:lysine biosynthesis protein LysW